VVISGYNSEFCYFEGRWVSDASEARLNRLELVFDGEDPVSYADRIAKAFQSRHVVNQKIRFLFYVDNMPTDGINTLDSDQVQRVKTNARNIASLQDAGMDFVANNVTKEISLDFARVMNRLTLVASGKVVAPDFSDEEGGGEGSSSGFGGFVPWYALYPVPSYNFTNTFSSFCFSSLYIKPEVIDTLCQARDLCLNLLLSGQKIFCTKFPRNSRLDQFKALQQTSIQQMLAACRTWSQDLRKIVVSNFEDVEKGWYSIKETNAETYRYGKIKKLLTMIRFLMETTIFELTKSSLLWFEQKMLSYTPLSLKIKSLTDVQVEVRDPTEEQVKLGLSRDAQAGVFLMEVKVTQRLSDKIWQVQYSGDGDAFLDAVPAIIDNGLFTMADIVQVEQLVMSHFFKRTDAVQHIETIHPVTDPFVQRIKENLEKQMRPFGNRRLEDYRKRLEPFLAPLTQDVDAIIAEKEDEDNPATIQEIKNHILNEKAKEEVIYESLPDSINAGLFEITTSEARSLFARKHNAIATALLELIQRRYRNMAEDLLSGYNAIKIELRKPPQDIEQLTELKEYMEAIPTELTKLEIEAKKVFEVYDILIDDFKLKMGQEMTDLRWSCFRGAKDCSDTMAEVNVELQDKMKSFFKEIQQEQFQFDDTLSELEEEISNFVNFTDLSDAHTINEAAESISERLKSNAEQAKAYNIKEY